MPTIEEIDDVSKPTRAADPATDKAPPALLFENDDNEYSDDDEEFESEEESEQEDESEEESDDEEEEQEPWYRRASAAVSNSTAVVKTRAAYNWTSNQAAKLWTKGRSTTYTVVTTAVFVATPFVLAWIAKEKQTQLDLLNQMMSEQQQNPFGAAAPSAAAPDAANPMAGKQA